ncbi:hypothetical protein ENUP19_0248G0018 [Entamoeba nuttalli]|uniref:CCR4-NOT transcription complex subunit 11 n=2 Tax=Entamoeba nuttalli TaxID=412467 RepID=K2H2K4_ENTNP|nr:hypothetical protein ENU1_046810 [Entamoeba nuttalli P19]EKE41718.1 hypothetical protein ENU1_046810 [Entamoeba nuttalli P19]|eukprot:XP_008855943.1 hypothetical protein ENU1_046810 [Entamoeba nuttalli P19]
MPQPQHIIESLNILNDSSKSLDQINGGIIHLVSRSDLFGLLTSLSILLDSQVLSQPQALSLCYVLSKHSPITSNPFFKVLRKEYLKADGFEKNFIATLFVNCCPSEKSISEILANNKLPSTSFDLDSLTTEYQKNVPYDIPSVQPLFSDPDDSTNRERDIAKIFETPLPGPIIPPQNTPAPLLLMPGHDELTFLIPEIDFSPLFDPTQISAETLTLLKRAVTERLNDDDKDQLMELLEEENIAKFFAPQQIESLIENNKDIAIEVLKKVINSENEKAYVDTLSSIEPKLNVISTVKELLLKSSNVFSSFTQKVIDFSIKEKEPNKRYIRCVTDYLETYVRVNQKLSEPVYQSIVTFCGKFSTIKEVSNLYKLLMK